MNRRGFLGAILAAAAAPAIVRADALMRIVPRETAVWTLGPEGHLADPALLYGYDPANWPDRSCGVVMSVRNGVMTVEEYFVCALKPHAWRFNSLPSCP